MDESAPRLYRVTQVGDYAVDFALANTDGQLYSLRVILAKNPIVLAFYRGDW